MKRLVIFDLDGTLLNTVADIAAATNHALAAYGYPTHPVDKIRCFVGNGINKLFERALPEGHKDEAEVLRIRAAFIPYYNEHGAERTFPYPGIPELLAQLQAQGIKLAVASNKYQEATAQLVAHFFPDIRFEAVLGQRREVPSKPNPRIVEEICALSGTERPDVLYVGDSGVDMETAANACVEVVGVTWGCRPRTELEKYEPDWLVDRAEEILPIALENHR